ncbi:MAG: ABC transporter substrate-binding protein [Myxococcales bacterium]|nr:ABC transporter substrate-binding protein [Myxococcales bacterium]
MVLALDWLPEPEFGGFYAARATGAFADRGIDVEIRGGGAGVPVLQMVATGKVEFGIAGADEVLTARARGADVVPVFAVFQTSPQGIMVHAARGAKTLSEALSGGTLAIEPGLAYALYLKKKIGFDKVKVVPYDGGVARFVADKDFAQQCYATSEPLAARAKGSDPQVFLVADQGWNPYLGVVIARASLVREKPSLVRAFVLGARAGWASYLSDPGPANAVMAALNRAMAAETFAEAAAAQRRFIESDDTRRSGLGAMTRDRWETLAAQLVDLGLVDDPNVPELASVK